MQIKKPYLLAIAAGIGLVILAAGFVLWQVKKPGGFAKPSPAVIEATPAMPEMIVMEDNAFKPAIYKVTRGASVTWKNTDNVAHTVTSQILGGQHVVKPDSTYTFDTAALPFGGEVNYHCDFHPQMTATLAVVSGGTADSAFANFFNALTERQRDCIQKSLAPNRLFGLLEGYIDIPTQDEQRAIDLCIK